VLAGVLMSVSCGSGSKPATSGKGGAAGVTTARGGSGGAGDAGAGGGAGVGAGPAGAAGTQGTDAQAGAGGSLATDAGPDVPAGARCAALLALGPRYTVDSIPVDVDGDGRLDIVTAEGDSHVAVFRQNGTRSFADPEVYDIPERFLGRAIAAGDLNEDGAVDLAAVDDYARIQLLLSGGTGRFSVSEMRGTAQMMYSDIEIRDFDGDGHRDIAFLKNDDGQVALLWASGPATFLPAVTLPTCASPKRLLNVDANEDQRPDLVVACIGGSSRLLINNGGRSFTSSTFFTTRVVNGAASGDVNGDGHVDIVMVDSMLMDVIVLLGDGRGAFSQPTGLITQTLASPLSAALGDFDDDGITDLVVGYSNDPWLQFHRGMGDGHFQSGQTIATTWTAINVQAADIDRDGIDDLVVSNWGTGISIYFGPCP
jgi:adhesin/invasin